MSTIIINPPLNNEIQTLSTPKLQKVYQDNFDPGKGNALQAAVASIFGLDLSHVPNFIESPGGYENAIRAFCQDHHGDGECFKNCVKVPLLNGVDFDTNSHDSNNVGTGESLLSTTYEGKLCILRGKSPRGNHGHVVVAKRIGNSFQMVHDPHPDETFLDNSENAAWCIFFV